MPHFVGVFAQKFQQPQPEQWLNQNCASLFSFTNCLMPHHSAAVILSIQLTVPQTTFDYCRSNNTARATTTTTTASATATKAKLHSLAYSLTVRQAVEHNFYSIDCTACSLSLSLYSLLSSNRIPACPASCLQLNWLEHAESWFVEFFGGPLMLCID